MTEKSISFFVHQNLHSLARRLLKQIPAAIKKGQLYPLDHPYFVHSLQLVQETLTALFKYRSEVTFNMVENELYFGDLALVEDSINQRQFIEKFEQRNISSLTFLPGVTREELLGFMQILGREAGDGSEAATVMNKIREKNITNIQLGTVILSEITEGGREPVKFDSLARRQAQGVFFGSIRVIKQIINEVENNQKFSLDKVRHVVSDIVGMVNKDDKYLLGLTTIKNYDEYTYNHSVNVAVLSLYLGQLLGLNREQLSLLGEAAMLHDVGKVRIPNEILNKQGLLTPTEWQVMESHTVEGAEILNKVAGINSVSLAVAFEHHLHYDLSGYPKTERLKEVNLLSRLVTICDVYDAATSLRVYHAPILPAKVIALIISKKGTFFDPVLAKAFVQMMGVYPVGSLVRLDNQEQAVVYANNLNNILRPKVILVSPETAEQDPDIVDLEEIASQSKGFKRSIVEALAPQAFKIEVTKYFYNKR
ncbi:MAG: HD-GYP domain-containing protein [Elusimicrobia bacterium]|nr:HD-GYP domain-containing protein [Elusimicrobiota bacterium]